MSQPPSIERLPNWDLSELYTDISDSKIQLDLENALSEATQFQSTYQSKLHTLSPTQMKAAFIQIESILTTVYKVNQYLSLVFSTDTSNSTVKTLLSEAENRGADISNALLFFDLELSQLSQSDADKLLHSPEINPYGYAITRSIETAQFNLTEKEEQMINKKDITGVNAWVQYYEEITSDFEFEFEMDGDLKTLNGSQLRQLRLHPSPDVRRRAMRMFLDRYKDYHLTFSHIFNNVIKDYAIEKQMRGYPNAISRRNIGNDLPDNVVSMLHQVTTESYPLVQRYYKLKKQIQNLPDMTLADIYAPVESSDKTYSFEESKQIVLDGFYEFDTEFGDLAKLMFDQNRIDVPVSPKKRGGAFCSGSTPDIKPYVLLNFMGKHRDISTLAHELGHAIHDMYASQQSLTNYHPILPLAETASVFSEMLITDKLKKEETNKQALMALLIDKIEDIFATSHRQNMFSNFEIETHQRINTSIMSTESICQAYHQHLQALFGDSVAIPEEYHWEWATIPHLFEYPFYVYAYNFGNLMVMALYQHYRSMGKALVPKIKDMLRAGSVMSPIDITNIANISLHDPDFWRQSLAYIESLIDELEQLVNIKKIN